MPQTEPASKAATAPRSVQDTTPSATPPAGAGSAANDAGTTPNASPSQKSVVATGRGNTVIIPNIDTRVVIRGDNLWQISRTTYGRGIRYTVIYKANRDQIRDPDLIYPGQIFVLPKARP
jgi:nucleoid-associated protein YgaU